MDNRDSNSAFKVKVSRSLTDLQNSLDEACRLGLPPAMRLDDMNERQHSIWGGGSGAGVLVRHDVVYGSAVETLERMVRTQDSREERQRHQMRERPSTKGAHRESGGFGDSRGAYMDALRMLAAMGDCRGSMGRRSRSAEAAWDRRGADLSANGQHKENSREALPRDNRLFRSRLARTQMDAQQQQVRRSDISLGRIDTTSRSRSASPSPCRCQCQCQYQSARSAAATGRGGGLTTGAVSHVCMAGMTDHGGCVSDDQQMQARITEMKERERELLNELRDAIGTIEEAKHEEMQAVLRAEQSKEELENMKQRFQEMVDRNQKRVESAARQENTVVMESMMKVKEEVRLYKEESTEKSRLLREAQEQLKCARVEIERLEKQLEVLQAEQQRQNEDLQISATRALLHRDETLALNERLQSTLDRERSRHSQDKSILQQEINELKIRLSSSENAQLIFSKDKMNLVNQLSQSKSEMMQFHQTYKMEKDRLKEDYESMIRAAQDRIHRLEGELSRKQAYFDTMMSDAQVVMQQQIALISKLKHELGYNVHGMDGFVDRHREEVGAMQAKLERCSEDLANYQTVNRELQQTIDEYGSTLEAMRTSYRALEAKNGRQDTEIIAHLSRQNELMKVVESMSDRLQEMRTRISDCTCGAFDCADDACASQLLDKVSMFAH